MKHYSMHHLRALLLPLLVAALLVPGIYAQAAHTDTARALPAQAGTPVTKSCPFGGIGDRVDRGFYVDNFDANHLDSVTLEYNARDTGTFTIQMTAREDTYGGPVIGTATITFTYTGGDVMQTFTFGGAKINSSRVTFEQTLVSGPTSLIFYDTGSGTCPDFTQTDGTTPPLDSFRGDTVGVIIEGRLVQEGCRANLSIPGHAVGGRFLADAQAYWAPDRAIPGVTIAAGKSARVLGMDASGRYYQIIWGCQKLWVPVHAMGPNFDSVWNGAPLPTVVVE